MLTKHFRSELFDDSNTFSVSMFLFRIKRFVKKSLGLFDLEINNARERFWRVVEEARVTGTRFIQKIYAPSSSLLQGKYLPCSSAPFSLNIFRLFVILSLTQLYPVVFSGYFRFHPPLKLTTTI
jgi:hypothetical protein